MATKAPKTKVPKTPEEETDRFLKILQYQSWFFLIVLIIDVFIILIAGLSAGLGLFSGLKEISLLIGLLSVIGAGFSFGLNYQIQATPSRRKNLFKSYFISLALVGVIAVLVLSVYEW